MTKMTTITTKLIRWINAVASSQRQTGAIRLWRRACFPQDPERYVSMKQRPCLADSYVLCLRALLLLVNLLHGEPGVLLECLTSAQHTSDSCVLPCMRNKNFRQRVHHEKALCLVSDAVQPG